MTIGKPDSPAELPPNPALTHLLMRETAMAYGLWVNKSTKIDAKTNITDAQRAETQTALRESLLHRYPDLRQAVETRDMIIAENPRHPQLTESLKIYDQSVMKIITLSESFAPLNQELDRVFEKLYQEFNYHQQPASGRPEETPSAVPEADPESGRPPGNSQRENADFTQFLQREGPLARALAELPQAVQPPASESRVLAAVDASMANEVKPGAPRQDAGIRAAVALYALAEERLANDQTLTDQQRADIASNALQLRVALGESFIEAYAQHRAAQERAAETGQAPAHDALMQPQDQEGPGRG